MDLVNGFLTICKDFLRPPASTKGLIVMGNYIKQFICMACMMPCLFAPIPVYADQPVCLPIAGGLQVRILDVEGGQPQAIRIEVAPRDASMRGPGHSEPLSIGDCVVSFDDGEQELRVSHKAGGRWSARFRHLDAFGRAGVPGLEVAWRATDGEAMYGLGERFDALNVAGRCTEMWIVDEPGQGDGSASYFVTPVLYSSAGYGLFATNNPEGLFDLNSNHDGWHRYQRAGLRLSFTLTFGPDVPSMIRDRTEIIGGLEPAPAWAYSPWISKNSYETQAEAEAAMDGMQSRGLPFGVIVLEAWKGHSEAGGFNRFSTDRWPDIEGFMRRCERDNVKVVLWQVPILHPSSPWFAQAKAKGYVVRDPSGGVSLREGWLAGFGNIDFLNPEAAAFWKDMLRPVVRLGVAGFKADDGESIKPTDVLGDGVSGWQAHNEYSARYNQATYDVFKEEGVDGMLWARSGSLGIEKSPALWAGDQEATWEQMRRLVTAGLSSSISGMPYWGHDIGGYYGECTPELYIRWLQLGALSPFMQFHGIDPREPWHFGDEAIEAYRLLANLRMNLSPTLIDLGDAASQTGMPIIRPMFFVTGEHGGMEATDQYMLGNDMLVAPVMEGGATGRIVRFPEGRWLHALSPMLFEGPGEFSVPIGLADAPLFIREGSVLKMALAEGSRLGQWSGDEVTATLIASPKTLWGEVSVLLDVQAPLQGQPLGDTVAVCFNVDMPGGDGLRARWWYEDSPDEVFDAPVTISPQGSGRADITPQDIAAAVGRQQVYELADASALTPNRLITGRVDWNDLIRIDLNDPHLDVVTAGQTRFAGRVVNRTFVTCDVELHVVAPNGITPTSPSQSARLDPGHSVDFDWLFDVNVPRNSVGDSRVTVEARVNGVAIDRADAALIHPPRWLLAGPFPADSKAQGFGATTAAEWSFGPDARFRTTEGLLRWEAIGINAVAQMNGLDFNKIYGEHTNAFAYATAVIHSDREQPVQLRVGSDDTLSLWVNGDMLIAETYDRPALPDQNIIDAVLKEGDNRVLIKVAQGVGGWGLVTRITNPDGGPVQGLTEGLTDVNRYRKDRPKEGAEIDAGAALDWQALGPFPYDPKAGVHGETAIEDTITNGRPLPKRVGDQAWKKLETGNAAGWIDLKPLTHNSHVILYCVTEFEVDQPTEVELRCGSDDGLVLWLDDQRIIDSELPRAYQPGQDVARVKLDKGNHRIVARISQGRGDWGFDVRLWDVGGTPHVPLGADR
jgi:alpha-D-xyloside xylohydrolase